MQLLIKNDNCKPKYKALKKIYLLTFGLLLITTLLNSQNLYWVGGSGSWNDQSHWSTSSGGNSVNAVPDEFNDVIIDQNSVSEGDIITIGVNSIMNSLLIDTKDAFTISTENADIIQIKEEWVFLQESGLKLELSNTLIRVIDEPDFTKVDYVSGGVFYISGEIEVWKKNLWKKNGGADEGGDKAGHIPVVTITDPLCNGSSTGSALGSVIGGTGPFQYVWTGGDLGSSLVIANPINNLGAGNYTLIVFDLSDPPGTLPPSINFTINEPSIINGFFLKTAPSCGGASDGVVNAALIFGGIPGTTNYDVQWSTGFSETGVITSSISGLVEGPYWITITDSNNCQVTRYDTLIDPTPVIINASVTDASCNGFNDGAVNTNATSGNGGPFTYLWGPDGETTASISNKLAGTYTLHVEDVNNCSKDTTIIIDEPLVLTASITSLTHLICNGDCTPGEAIVTPTGGTFPFTYQWSDAGGPIAGYVDSTASNLCAGTYSVSITDVNLCNIVINNIIISEPPVLTSVSSASPALCNGDATGSVVVTPSGGVLPYTYAWTTLPGPVLVGTDSLVNNLPAGSYDFEVTDFNGCVIIGTEVITEPDTIGFDFAKLDLLCFGDVNGQAVISNIMGGDGNYSYLWQDAGLNTIGTGTLVTNLSVGNYSITVSDGNNCSTLLAFEIIEPLALSLSVSSDSVLCNGGSTGAIHVIASGGTIAVDYIYDWRNASNVQVGTTADVSGLPIGTYQVIVTDDNGCSDNAFITIEEPLIITVIPSITDLTCNGILDGAISVVISGGTPGYLTSWTGPNGFTSTNQNISALEGGNYTLTITDVNACVEVQNYFVDEPAPIVFTPTIVDVLCNGNATGSIQVAVIGGNGGYTYDWRDDTNTQISTTDAIVNVGAGDYTLTVTDLLLCTHTETYTINEISEIFFNANIGLITCFDADDGTIFLAPTGGTPAYTYAWIGPNAFNSTNQNISALESGDYTCTISDQNFCSKDTTITLVNPPAIIITESTFDLTCNSDSSGAIDVVVSGGTPIYLFSWTGPNGFVSTDQNIADLEAGVYNLMVTDANICIVNESYTLDQPSAISVISTITDILCKGDSTASIEVLASGGSGTYTYDWRDITNNLLSITNEIIDVPAGDYTLTVSDITGCSAIELYTIQEPLQALSLDLDSINISCFGDNNGQVAVAISGGTVVTPADYIIEWFDESNTSIGTTAIVTNLPSGIYTVVVTDLNNCTESDSIEVAEPDEIVVTFSYDDVLCNGDASGWAMTTPSGGTIAIDYSYEWENVLNPGIVISTTNSINNVAIGDYQVTVSDDNGCSKTETITIGEPSALSLTFNGVQPLCNGDANGQLQVTASGGTVALDYSYEWKDAIGNIIGTNALITGLTAGDYTILITDDNACDTLILITLGEPDLLSFTPTIQQISCAGTDDGQISVHIEGGSPNYNAVWTDQFNVTIGTDTIISNLAPGDYTFTVTDQNGCSYNESYTITPQNTITLTYNQFTLGDCSVNPPCTAEAEVIPVGGTGVYTNYQWVDATGTDLGINNDTATALCSGSYMVTVTDSDGCSGTTLVLINDHTPEDITVSTTDPICNGDLGTAIAEYVCSDAPCTIEWWNAFTNTSTGLTSNTVQLSAGEYFVSITNATGCTNNVLFTINEPTVIIPNPSSSDANCASGCDGTASVSPSGGLAPYTYLWDDAAAQTTSTAINLCAGNYQVTITDANLCDTTITISVLSPNAISVVADITDISCQGGTEGIIDLTATGGSGSYTYTWTPVPPIGNGTSIGSGLSAGDYSIDVADANDAACITSVTYTVAQPDSLLGTMATVESTCGSDDGIASVSVSGGSPAYSYLWDDPALQTGDTATSLFAGIYTVTVTDANLCTEDFSVAVNDQGADVVAVDIQDVLCSGDSSVVTAIYTCINPVCIITWHDDNGNILPITGDVATLPAGTYWVGIENGLGCKYYLTFEIIPINAIESNLVFTNVTCDGPDDGTASVNPNGGSGNYTYNWIPEPGSGQGTASVDGLYAGTWQVIITDDVNCDTTVTFDILPYTFINASVTNTNVSCNGDESAIAEVTASGGNAPLNYTWSPEPAMGQGTTIASGLYAGDWSVTIEDVSGCDTTLLFTVLEPSSLDSDSLVVNASCNLIPGDGSIDLMVFGGTAPYTYQWFDAAGNDLGVNTANITDLVEGIYHCVVIDDSLCSETFVASVSEMGGEDITTESMDVSCFGGDDGIAWVEYVCSDPPCTVNWYDALGVDLGLTTDTISNLSAGSYNVGVTNASNCISYENVIVGETSEIVIDIAIVEASCSGICDGEAAASVSGGTGLLTYLWIPEPGTGQGTPLAGELCGGTWILEVTDEIGCVNSVEFTISEIEVIESNIQIMDESCEGDCNGWASVNPTGGSGMYSYLWSPEPNAGQGTDSASGLCAGDWTVLITDLNTGCNLTEMFTVSQINPIYLTDTLFTYPECETDASGSITATVGGGITPYNYQWLDNSLVPIVGETDSVITGLIPGSYYLLITDDQGCTHSEFFTLNEESYLVANAGPDTSYCEGNGPATLVGSGNGINSLWMDILGNIITMGDSLIIDSPIGNYGYIYQISDGICTASDTAYIVVFVTPYADAGLDHSIMIDESVDIGGNPSGPGGSTFAWEPSTTLNDSTLGNPTATPTETTQYILYVEDFNGCTSTDSTIVTIKPRFTPNDGFTPNGDGINDVWTIGDLSDFPNVEVNIFNRWGEQLFTSRGYTEPWDGMYNGKGVPVGTYYYVIDLKDEKYPDAFTGPLTIMR